MEILSNTRNLFITLIFSMVSVVSAAQTMGIFKGKIIEQSTKQPIIGANVHLDNTQMGTVTDTLGVFTINNIPIGSYSVTISYVSYQTKNIGEIIITSNKAYYSEFELLEEVMKMNEVKVMGFKGEDNPLTPVSTYSYSREEIFRNPGAQGDIMRALSVLPGVVSSGAQFSAIAARGQGTQDNVYMVDDIPMFNLSHLESEGSNSGFNDPNGGRFSIFAPRVIDNVQFQNGGFDAINGRKSSSYLNLGIKEGNKETWSYSGQLDLLGGTLIADGPISKKTSIFSSARYQNFSAISNLLNFNNFGNISFGDYILKTTTNIDAKNKLSVVAIYNPEGSSRSIDNISSGIDINEDNSSGNVLYKSKVSKLMVGLNLRTLLNTSSYWKNVLYYRDSRVDNNSGRFVPSIDDDRTILDPKYGSYEDDLRHITNNQQEFGYRSIYNKKYKNLTLTAGIDAMLVNLDYVRSLKRTDTLFVFRSTDFRPNPSQYYQIVNPSQFNVNFDNSAFNGSGYISVSWEITDKFTLNPGVRYDYSGFIGKQRVSPRVSGTISLSQRHSINFATGLYYQDPGFSDLAGQSADNKLKPEQILQSILGYKIQFSPDLKLVAEGWYKQLDNLIVQPNRFQRYLNNNGTGDAYGADLNLVKRLSRKYYGQIGYSYMVSKRDDNNGFGEYDYTFNIPHTINALISYKPNNKWIFSGKFRYSTGRPTDQYILHNNVLENPNMLRYAQEITATNGSRLPYYMALDLRIDYNIQMKLGTFSAFVDFANVNRRFNVNSEIFLSNTGEVYNIGLGAFPTFGVRVEL